MASQTNVLISKWCTDNGIIMNAIKTKFVWYRNSANKFDHSLRIILDRGTIEQADNVKFLGIHIDRYLTWKKHIDSLVNNLCSALFAIKVIKSTVTRTVCSYCKKELYAVLLTHT